MGKAQLSDNPMPRSQMQLTSETRSTEFRHQGKRNTWYRLKEHNFRIHLATSDRLPLCKSVHQHELDWRLVLLPTRIFQRLLGSHDNFLPTFVLPTPSEGLLMLFLFHSLLMAAGPQNLHVPWFTRGRSKDPDFFLYWGILGPHGYKADFISSYCENCIWNRFKAI